MLAHAASLAERPREPLAARGHVHTPYNGFVAKSKKAPAVCARRYFVSGRVQGVGFRWFVEKVARDLDLTGYTRNLSNGRVEVYAVGPAEKLSELSGHLHVGPRMAHVQQVEEVEAEMLDYSDFRIEYF